MDPENQVILLYEVSKLKSLVLADKRFLFRRNYCICPYILVHVVHYIHTHFCMCNPKLKQAAIVMKDEGVSML